MGGSSSNSSGGGGGNRCDVSTDCQSWVGDDCCICKNLSQLPTGELLHRRCGSCSGSNDSGGGGSGAPAQTSKTMIGGGGGSGAYIIQTFDLSNTNDNTITIRTGKGGAPGSNGGQTTISIGGVTMIASGGFGGSTIGQGGSGGQVNLTSPFAKGNAGANGSSTTGQGGTLTQQITNGSGGNGGYATIGSSGSDGYAYAIVFSLA